MSQSVSSAEAAKAFGRTRRQALVAPLIITHRGQDRLVLMSATEYRRLKSRDRAVYTLNDIPEEIADAVRIARAPADAAAFNHEVES